MLALLPATTPPPTAPMRRRAARSRPCSPQWIYTTTRRPITTTLSFNMPPSEAMMSLPIPDPHRLTSRQHKVWRWPKVTLHHPQTRLRGVLNHLISPIAPSPYGMSSHTTILWWTCSSTHHPSPTYTKADGICVSAAILVQCPSS